MDSQTAMQRFERYKSNLAETLSEFYHHCHDKIPEGDTRSDREHNFSLRRVITCIDEIDRMIKNSNTGEDLITAIKDYDLKDEGDEPSPRLLENIKTQLPAYIKRQEIPKPSELERWL